VSLRALVQNLGNLREATGPVRGESTRKYTGICVGRPPKGLFPVTNFLARRWKKSLFEGHRATPPIRPERLKGFLGRPIGPRQFHATSFKRYAVDSGFDFDGRRFAAT